MVIVVAEGRVTFDELMEHFAALEAANAGHFRRILDATRGGYGLSKEDIAKLAAYNKSLTGRGTPGPMAVVTGSEGNDEAAASVRAMLRPSRRNAGVPDHPRSPRMAGPSAAWASVQIAG